MQWKSKELINKKKKLVNLIDFTCAKMVPEEIDRKNIMKKNNKIFNKLKNVINNLKHYIVGYYESI